jgi:rsbT co-antagonist protein RsbR
MKKDGSDHDYQEIIESEKMYRQIIEYSVETIIIHVDHKVLYINQSGAQFLRAPKEEIIGACVLDIFQENVQTMIKERIQRGMMGTERAELIEQIISRFDGTTVDVELYCQPVLFGGKKAIQSAFRDITERKEAERKHKKLSREINEISAPIVPVLEGISVLPLVGAIDSDRARQLLDDLPPKIKKLQVECLIIDFSGLYSFDKVVIDYLLQIHTVMQLLGVRTIMTGIRPEFAALAIQLDTNICSMETKATVKQALHSLGVKK